MRTLLIFIALALIVMAGRQLLRKPRDVPRTRSVSGRMVRCSHCGIFVPEQEALEKDGQLYCSREHRDAAREPS